MNEQRDDTAEGRKEVDRDPDNHSDEPKEEFHLISETTWAGDRRSGRWRGIGCGCALVVLVGVIVMAYVGLKGRVWSTYESVRAGVSTSILAEVGPEKKGELLERLDAFDRAVKEADDPYRPIGRFVAVGRRVLADLVIEKDEAEDLDQLLQKELARLQPEDGGS